MRNRTTLTLSAASALALAAWCHVGLTPTRIEAAPPAPPAREEPAAVRDVVGRFCVGCHEGENAKGGLDLASVADADVGRHPQVWEKVVRKLRGRQMPPPGRTRPDED